MLHHNTEDTVAFTLVTTTIVGIPEPKDIIKERVCTRFAGGPPGKKITVLTHRMFVVGS